MLATESSATVNVACPTCHTVFVLPVMYSVHQTSKDAEPFVRGRVDHTNIDAHISTEHGVPLA